MECAHEDKEAGGQQEALSCKGIASCVIAVHLHATRRFVVLVEWHSIETASSSITLVIYIITTDINSEVTQPRLIVDQVSLL